MDALANVNGETMPLEAVRISALDRGFLFGDAIYEVLRVYRGKPWLEEGHFKRLARSLREVRLEGIDLERLRRRMRETLKTSGFQEATIYIQITRGSAPRSHLFPANATPLEFLFVQPFQDYREARQTGARAITYPDQRWGRCDIKSTNLLANVLAAQAAHEAGFKEALLYLPDGKLTEGTHTSLFGVKHGCLRTAPEGPDILPGITRDFILQLAKEIEVPVVEENLRLQELDDVSELLLSGTTSEVLPIVQVDGKVIGKGAPGEVTRRLQKAYEDEVAVFTADS
ncbi:MAG: aminotransferase class IV [Gemmataceae bacterium]